MMINWWWRSRFKWSFRSDDEAFGVVRHRRQSVVVGRGGGWGRSWSVWSGGRGVVVALVVAVVVAVAVAAWWRWWRRRGGGVVVAVGGRVVVGGGGGR